MTRIRDWACDTACDMREINWVQCSGDGAGIFSLDFLKCWQNVEDYLTKVNKKLPTRVNKKLPTRANTPLSSNYRPEVDVTPELDTTQSAYYQSLVGILRWMVELDRFHFSISFFYHLNPVSLSLQNGTSKTPHLLPTYNYGHRDSTKKPEASLSTKCSKAKKDNLCLYVICFNNTTLVCASSPTPTSLCGEGEGCKWKEFRGRVLRHVRMCW